MNTIARDKLTAIRCGQQIVLFFGLLILLTACGTTPSPPPRALSEAELETVGVKFGASGANHLDFIVPVLRDCCENNRLSGEYYYGADSERFLYRHRTMEEQRPNPQGMVYVLENVETTEAYWRNLENIEVVEEWPYWNSGKPIYRVYGIFSEATSTSARAAPHYESERHGAATLHNHKVELARFSGPNATQESGIALFWRMGPFITAIRSLSNADWAVPASTELNE